MFNVRFLQKTLLIPFLHQVHIKQIFKVLHSEVVVGTSLVLVVVVEEEVMEEEVVCSPFNRSFPPTSSTEQHQQRCSIRWLQFSICCLSSPVAVEQRVSGQSG